MALHQYVEAYSYSASNPIIITDDTGEIIIKCNNRASIEKAFGRAKKYAIDCIMWSWPNLEDIINKGFNGLNIIRCVSKNDINCKRGLCGYIEFNRITICPEAYDENRCGCLESTIFHKEVHHAGEQREDITKCIEAKCVPCSGLDPQCECENVYP